MQEVLTADTDYVLEWRSEEPVGHVHLVRSKLGSKSAGEFAVFAPVLFLVGASCGNGLVPRILGNRVSMPLAADVRHRAEFVLVDHLLHGLVELAVATLQSDLQNLLGPGI